MIQISIDDMSRDWPEYLHRAEAGETVVIVRAGKPVAELKPPSSNTAKSPLRKSRPSGQCAGDFVVSDDFNEPLPDGIIAEFEGR